MFGVFVASLAVGAIAGGVGAAMSARAARKQARAQARYQKAQNEARRKTTLGTMEHDLVEGMTSTYEQAGDITGQINAQSTSAMSNTYLGQLASESELTNMKQQDAEASGALNLQMGASGAEQDVTLQTVINSQMQQQENEKRSAIDASRDLSVFQNDTNVANAKTTQNRMLTKYNPGDAVMRRYEYTRRRVNAEADITSSYMDDIIKENKYNATWFAADALGFLSSAAGAGQSYALYSGSFKKS